MLETNRLRDIYEEARRSLDQINAWHKEQEAKEEKLKVLIREKNRNEKQVKDLESVNN